MLGRINLKGVKDNTITPQHSRLSAMLSALHDQALAATWRKPQCPESSAQEVISRQSLRLSKGSSRTDFLSRLGNQSMNLEDVPARPESIFHAACGAMKLSEPFVRMPEQHIILQA